ncbi:MAG: iron-sulfur cluster assembly protein [Deinococcota bacterium]|jgi:ATP-binding protein involved in chromosome partitioning|nr:iron-sulfur cluster assembly protein [Deinococcota bacterium]
MVDLVEVSPSVYADQVKHALETVVDPERRRSIIELGLVSSVKVTGQQVTVTLVQPAGRPLSSYLLYSVRRAVSAFPAVRSVEVKITDPPAKAKLQEPHRLHL